MADADLCCQKQSAERRTGCGRNIGQKLCTTGANTVAPRGLLAQTHRPEMQAAARPIEPEVAETRQGQQCEEGVRQKRDPGRERVYETGIDHTGRYGAQVERDPL